MWSLGIDVAVKKPARVSIAQHDTAAPWHSHKWPIRYTGNVSDSSEHREKNKQAWGREKLRVSCFKVRALAGLWKVTVEQTPEVSEYGNKMIWKG